MNPYKTKTEGENKTGENTDNHRKIIVWRNTLKASIMAEGLANLPVYRDLLIYLEIPEEDNDDGDGPESAETKNARDPKGNADNQNTNPRCKSKGAKIPQGPGEA